MKTLANLGFTLILVQFLWATTPAWAAARSPGAKSAASEVQIKGLRFADKQSLSTRVPFDIPEKTVSAQIEIKGIPDRQYLIDSLEGPGSLFLVVNHLDKLAPGARPKDLAPLDSALARLYGEEGSYSALSQYLSPIRSEPGLEPGTATLLLVAPPGKFLSPGAFHLQMRQLSASPTAHSLSGQVLLKSAGTHAKTLRLLFVLTGSRGWNKGHPDLNLLIDYLKPILSQANIAVKPFFLEADLQSYLNLETAEQMSALFSWFEATKTGQNRSPHERVIPVFLVNRFDLIGNVSYSPGIPGPCGSLFKGFGIIASVGETNLSLAEHATILAHEIGHFLGLRHIYENSSSHLVDDLSDTPTRADIKPNEYWLMDPRPSVRGGVIPRLSPQQADRMNAHWLIH